MINGVQKYIKIWKLNEYSNIPTTTLFPPLRFSQLSSEVQTIPDDFEYNAPNKVKFENHLKSDG